MEKPTRLIKSAEILRDAKYGKWCYVNTDNEFEFEGKIYKIDESVKEYKVYNKAQYINGKLNDFTNEAYMEEVFVVVDKQNKLSFYNQNLDPIDNNLVKCIEEGEEK